MASILDAHQDLDTFEQAVARDAARAAVDKFAELARRTGLGFARLADDCIRVDGHRLFCRFGPDPLDHRSLIVNFEPATRASALSQRADCKVAGHGAFSKAEVFTPRHLPYAESIAETVRLRIERSYRDRTQDFLEDLGRREAKTAAPAYAALRRHLPERAANRIWLYQVEGDQGRYLTDNRCSNLLLAELAARSQSERPRSTLSLAEAFATRTLPLRDTFSDRALRERCTLLSNVTKARYADGAFEFAEQDVMGGEVMITRPLVTEGRIRLLAGYPVQIAGQVDSALTELTPDLKTICSNHAGGRWADWGSSRNIAIANEYLNLKPALFGVGLNLNALITSYLERRRRRH